MEPCPNPYYFAIIVFLAAVLGVMIAVLWASTTADERTIGVDPPATRPAARRAEFIRSLARSLVIAAVVIVPIAVLLWMGGRAECPPVLS